MRKALDVLLAILLLPLILFFAAWGTFWLLWDVVRGRPARWHDEEEELIRRSEADTEEYIRKQRLLG